MSLPLAPDHVGSMSSIPNLLADGNFADCVIVAGEGLPGVTPLKIPAHTAVLALVSRHFQRALFPGAALPTLDPIASLPAAAQRVVAPLLDAVRARACASIVIADGVATEATAADKAIVRLGIVAGVADKSHDDGKRLPFRYTQMVNATIDPTNTHDKSKLAGDIAAAGKTTGTAPLHLNFSKEASASAGGADKDVTITPADIRANPTIALYDVDLLLANHEIVLHAFRTDNDVNVLEPIYRYSNNSNNAAHSYSAGHGSFGTRDGTGARTTRVSAYA